VDGSRAAGSAAPRPTAAARKSRGPSASTRSRAETVGSARRATTGTVSAAAPTSTSASPTMVAAIRSSTVPMLSALSAAVNARADLAPVMTGRARTSTSVPPTMRAAIRRDVLEHPRLLQLWPCPSGFSGPGATGCADINECATNRGGCDGLVDCSTRSARSTKVEGFRRAHSFPASAAAAQEWVRLRAALTHATPASPHARPSSPGARCPLARDAL
jgi:hypothetical protein